MKMKNIILILLIVLFPFLIFANQDKKESKKNFYFLNNGYTSVSFIDRPIDKRFYGNYGWEADVSGGFYLIGYKNIFLSFDGIVQTISKNRPFNVDFLAANYNLIPGIGYEKDKQRIRLILYHWSLHYFNSELKNLDNINLLGPQYSYFANNILFSLFLGMPLFTNDYKYRWDFQMIYRQNLWNFVYFSSLAEIAKISNSILFDQKFETGFYFKNKNENTIDLFFGYADGKIIPPKGFYWGFRMNF